MFDHPDCTHRLSLSKEKSKQLRTNSSQAFRITHMTGLRTRASEACSSPWALFHFFTLFEHWPFHYHSSHYLSCDTDLSLIHFVCFIHKQARVWEGHVSLNLRPHRGASQHPPKGAMGFPALKSLHAC